MKKLIFFLILTVILSWQLPFIKIEKGYASVEGWQKGATIDPVSPTIYSSSNLRESLSNLASSGANYVGFVIPYYQSSETSTDLSPGWNTPTDQSLIDGIATAHSLGLKVMLKIHPELKSGVWRAMINPENKTQWFKNYGDILNHYAEIGQQHGVETICLGAETFKVTTPTYSGANTENWEKLISDVRSRYSGLLTYSAQHSGPNEASEIEFWDKLDFIGYAAYWPIAGSVDNPTIDDLKNSWASIDSQIISPVAQKWGKPVMFTEIGYRSMVDTHKDPWNWSRNDIADEEEQARNYEALFSYWNDRPYFAGVHLWKWEADPNAGGAGDNGYTPQNKKAQTIMNQWFGGQNNITPTPSPEITPIPEEPTPTQIPENTPTPTPSPANAETDNPINTPTPQPQEPTSPSENPPNPDSAVTPTPKITNNLIRKTVKRKLVKIRVYLRNLRQWRTIWVYRYF